MINKKFKINNFIKLKLIDGHTEIYVNNEWFIQCKYLLLNIPVKETDVYDSVQSVDDVAENLDHALEGKYQIDLPPEIEFWGHCSNLQAWAENNYNSQILHSNIAFPLLRKLIEVGDSIARRVFTEEIARRIESGHKNVIIFLIEEGYINLLNREELNSLDYEKIINMDTEVTVAILKRFLELDVRDVKKLFKKKIVEGFKSGNESAINYLYEEEYLDYLSEEEHLDIIPKKEERNVLKKIEGILGGKFIYYPYSLDGEDSLKFGIDGDNVTGIGFYQLDLKEGVLNKIIKSLIHLKQLKTLCLDHNKLKGLPDYIGNLNSLQHLYLEHNSLSELPESLGNLKNLTTLVLNDNTLNKLPKSIIKLKDLRNLYLQNNSLKRIDVQLGELKLLESLDLKNNLLIAIPIPNKDIENLKYFNI